MMDSYIVKDRKQLRLGVTTGSCAAAAAKAAAILLLTARIMERIHLKTPKGILLNIPLSEITLREGGAFCSVKKDSGDDPDITNGTLICAEVRKINDRDIVIDGGQGIGRVTKRGLDQPVGAAAINSVPRQMIRENLEEVCQLADYHEGLSVIITAPDGERLAQKTFNSRLGIIGGISILGTSGIVEPMSDQALIDTIHTELRQRKDYGEEYILLTPGNYGIDFIKNNLGINPSTAVMTSNFIGDTLDICCDLGFKGIVLTGHIGKLVKLAGNMLNTHSRYGDCRMEIIASNAGACGLSVSKIAEILDCATCDDAIRIIKEDNLLEETLSKILTRISFNLSQRTRGEIETEIILFSNAYGLLAETSNARSILAKVTKD